jgi:hypothetical protein
MTGDYQLELQSDNRILSFLQSDNRTTPFHFLQSHSASVLASLHFIVLRLPVRNLPFHFPV